MIVSIGRVTRSGACAPASRQRAQMVQCDDGAAEHAATSAAAAHSPCSVAATMSPVTLPANDDTLIQPEALPLCSSPTASGIAAW